MAITITTKGQLKGFDEFNYYLKGMTARMKDPRKALAVCAMWARDQVKRYFISAADRAKDNIDWPEKSELWKELEKPKGSKPLRYTGRLMNSIGAGADSSGFAYGTNVDYARIHNEGSGGKKVNIFVWVRKLDNATSVKRSKEHSAGTLMGYRLALKDEPGAVMIGIRQRIYKREFLTNPPPRFIQKWMSILQEHYLKEK